MTKKYSKEVNIFNIGPDIRIPNLNLEVMAIVMPGNLQMLTSVSERVDEMNATSLHLWRNSQSVLGTCYTDFNFGKESVFLKSHLKARDSSFPRCITSL